MQYKVKTHPVLFRKWDGLKGMIQHLQGIVQNEMEIDDVQLKHWEEGAAKTVKDLQQLIDDSKKWVASGAQGRGYREVESNTHKKLVKHAYDETLVREEPIQKEEVPKNVKIVEATRANLYGDPYQSITYTLARVRDAFPGQIFEFKKKYEFTYEDGRKIIFNRNTDRFYSGKLGSGYEDMKFVPKGATSAAVYHKIVSIEEYGT